jgi:NAD(P)-dependent dehydrogenase (short-subunit alcohol dehydrogenase family)
MAPAGSTALVTGASRGLGLEFVRQLATRGDRVFAACRTPSSASMLARIAREHGPRVTLVELDVDEPSSIEACAKSVAAEMASLDLLINCAGVYSARGSKDPDAAGETLGRLDMQAALDVLRTNAVGPLLVAQAVLGLLARGRNPRIISLTSGYGSVSSNTSGFPYYYSASKAALNQLMRSLAHDAASSGITTVVLDPGWVRTDMGGAGAPLEPAESVAGMLRVIDALTPADRGRFLDWRGRAQPW